MDKIYRMTHSLRALLLLTVLLWQSLAMLGTFSIRQRAGEMEHLTVHVQDADHHHHADHTLHMDVEEGTAQHFHADAGTGGSGLLSAAWSNFFEVRSMGVAESPAALWLSPTLEGPLRPPQRSA